MQAIKNAFFVLLDNFDYVVILLLLFVAIAALCYAVVVILWGGQSETQLRLAKMLGLRRKKQEETDRPKFLDQQQPDTMAAKISRPLHRLATLDDRVSAID